MCFAWSPLRLNLSHRLNSRITNFSIFWDNRLWKLLVQHHAIKGATSSIWNTCTETHLLTWTKAWAMKSAQHFICRSCGTRCSSRKRWKLLSTTGSTLSQLPEETWACFWAFPASGFWISWSTILGAGLNPNGGRDIIDPLQLGLNFEDLSFLVVFLVWTKAGYVIVRKLLRWKRQLMPTIRDSSKDAIAVQLKKLGSNISQCYLI